MIKFVTIIVLLTSVLNIGISEKCIEEDLKECLQDLKQLVTTELQNTRNTDKSRYCQLMEKEGKCMTEGAESCKEKHPKISRLISSFFTYLSHMCTENWKVYMEMITCFDQHKSEFEKCQLNDKSNLDNPLEGICASVDGIQCLADLSKNVCEDSASFAKELEAQVKTVKFDVCSGVSKYYGHRCWILALLVLILLTNRNKF